MLNIPNVVSALAGLAALACALPSQASEEGSTLSYQGVFTDDGHTFALYTPGEEHNSPSGALKQYFVGVNSSINGESVKTDTAFTKRRYDPTSSKYPWLNCTFDGNFVGGCNKNHKTAPKAFYNARGYESTRANLQDLMFAAFGEPERGLNDPRSVCKTDNGNNLCVSWSRPVKGGMDTLIMKHIVDWSMQCIGPSGLLSSMYRTGFPVYSKGGDMAKDKQGHQIWEYAYVCVSNRAQGCTLSPWFCKDLWNKDPEESRSDNLNFVHWEPTSHTDWAKGPCTDNCDQL